MAECFFRIMDNNFGELTTGNVDFSSELTAFPASNVREKFRSQTWKPQGFFEVIASNRNIYFNDGTDKTANLDVGTYTSPASFATHIQTKLNLVGSGWSISYNTTLYKFVFANSGNVTLQCSSTTNAAWDTVGFTTTNDLGPNTSFTADEQRNHTHEFMTFDLGYSADMSSFFVVGPLDKDFTISSNATIKLQANNIDLWSSPPFEQTLTKYEDGIFHFIPSTVESGYRFWRFYIEDKLNPLGPEGLEFGNIYLGDYTTLDRNFSNGFQVILKDDSIITESESGALFFDKRTKYNEYSALEIGLMSKADRKTMLDLFNKVGVTVPFYISLDPVEKISDDQYFTKYVVFKEVPQFRQISFDLFSVSISFREVL